MHQRTASATRTVACALVVASPALAGSQGEAAPAPAIAWCGDIYTAMRRARVGEKPILVYVADLPDTSARVLEREVWTKPQVRRACARVVCLRIDRFARKPEASEWAMRFNAMSHPQCRFLNIWGQPLLEPRPVESAQSVVQQIERAVAKLPKRMRHPIFLYHLLGRAADINSNSPVNKDPRIVGLVEPSYGVGFLIRKGEAAGKRPRVTTRELARWFGSHHDVANQMELLSLLEGLPRDDASTALLSSAIRSRNDFVRVRALGLLSTMSEKPVREVRWLLREILRPGSAVVNPKQLLAATAQCAHKLAHRELIPDLLTACRQHEDRGAAAILAMHAIEHIGAVDAKADLRAVREFQRALAQELLRRFLR